MPDQSSNRGEAADERAPRAAPAARAAPEEEIGLSGTRVFREDVGKHATA